MKKNAHHPGGNGEPADHANQHGAAHRPIDIATGTLWRHHDEAARRPPGQHVHPPGSRADKSYLFAFAAGAASVAFWAARRDYRRWVALGEGGIPHGLRGWIRVTVLRVKYRGNRLSTEHLGCAADSPLADLPRRRGVRPTTVPYPVPHRQADGSCRPAMLAALDAVFASELARGQPYVREDTSRFERHHSALFVDCLAERGDSAHGEVGHIHRPQGSMHLHLRPVDAAAVIEKGWGELHPMAGKGFGLPAGYTLLYAPRDPGEVDMVRRVLRTTLDWASGRDE
jgi:hypothetical protein